MNLSLPWGTETLTFDVPDTWNIIFPEEKNTFKKKKTSETSIVKNSLKKPIGANPIGSNKLRGKKILIIVDDNTRPTPIFKFFHIILDALNAAGVSQKNILTIPALGIHTKMNEEEMAQKIGKKNLKKVQWENHEAFNNTFHHNFGTTSRNTPIKLNNRLENADFIITIGLIEPHLWAGFGGGLKNILPGIASAETISHHHEIIAEPPYQFNRVGVLPKDNSFRQDLEEIKGMIKGDIFCVNVCINHQNDIEACFSGDPIEAHRKGIEYNYEKLGRHLDKQVDGIIVNSFPMDINFKQSMKCVGNSLPAVKPGGTVMGFLKADRGIDDISLPEDAKPLWLVKRILRLIGPSRVRKFLDKARKGLNVEDKFLIYYSMQLIRQNELYFYAPSITEEEVKKMGFFIQCSDPKDVIKRGIRKLGKHATVAVFPEGGATFPILGKE